MSEFPSFWRLNNFPLYGYTTLTYPFIYFVCFFLDFLAISCNMWNLPWPGKCMEVQSHFPCHGSAECWLLDHSGSPLFISWWTFGLFLFKKIFFLLYNIVLVLPCINMNPPRVYTCSQSWTPLLSPSPYHPSGSSQCTSPKFPVSCIKPGLAIHFLYGLFLFLTIVSNVSINTDVNEQIPVQVPAFISFGYTPRSVYTPRSFPQWLYHFIFSSAMHKSQFLYTLTNICCFLFFFFF